MSTSAFASIIGWRSGPISFAGSTGASSLWAAVNNSDARWIPGAAAEIAPASKCPPPVKPGMSFPFQPAAWAASTYAVPPAAASAVAFAPRRAASTFTPRIRAVREQADPGLVQSVLRLPRAVLAGGERRPRAGQVAGDQEVAALLQRISGVLEVRDRAGAGPGGIEPENDEKDENPEEDPAERMSAFRHGKIGHDRPRYRFRNLPGGCNLSSLGRVKLVWRAVVASLLAVLFLTTVAEAGGGTVQNVATHSKIKVSDKSISPGDDLFIVGRLKSDKNACKINLVLKLFFKGNQVALEAHEQQREGLLQEEPAQHRQVADPVRAAQKDRHAPNTATSASPAAATQGQGQRQLTFRRSRADAHSPSQA